jgi:hypothetical protein
VNKEEKIILVEAVRLKDMIENEKEEIDFLKLDIEGGEVEVIKDLDTTLRKCKNLFIEYHSATHKKQNLSDILMILEKVGMRYYIFNQNKKFSPLLYMKTENKSQYDLILNIWACRI